MDSSQRGLSLAVKGAKVDKTDEKQESMTPIESKPKLMDKYWKQPNITTGNNEDIVVIHVCDENRQISKDFCCKRNLLVKHMKYFERFLAENENGYDDIDISVHCDVEIFEWLMNFVHEPDKPPQLEKSIVVSILISSEFLQMDILVDLCLQHIADCLNDIIKLPIDLSCISEKLVHKLAVMTSPKVLSQTKDRKDKILNKLYKRRVELDFSRKSGLKGGVRTIASSLTCCRYCGFIYLESCVSQLSCRSAPPLVDFRGRLARVHVPLQSWSLTAYLKALHAGGMGWDSIYWHVWACCEVLQVQDITFSLVEMDRYGIQTDGLLVHVRQEPVQNSFSLFSEDIKSDTQQILLCATKYEDLALPPYITPTLNPNRPLTVLTTEIFDLICSQAKIISNAQHKILIENTLKTMTAASLSAEEALHNPDAGDVLWFEPENVIETDEKSRGRSLSPTVQRKDKEGNNRKLAHSVGSKRNGDAESETQERKSRVATATSARLSRPSFGSSGRESAIGVTKFNLSDPLKPGINMSDCASVIENNDMQNGLLLRMIPVEVALQASICRGCFLGVRLWQHPLQTQPSFVLDIKHAIGESGLSESKKFEWELDLMRELDEKRMERYESYLCSSRNIASDTLYHSKSFSKQMLGKKKLQGDENFMARTNYYKDKGKFPTRMNI